ncbi:deleted in lung and esophageal cancer protein 1 homolog isoform 1 [Mus musculus]|uniref:Deleted in lung and esophageal cancer 1 n=1 Tax=Mus musculus TaxID=10090 RepID=E9Q8C0_MOUSE|nr:deleted in lung and esophageal cancer protein 1 homolog isoform 1 [Mus musculus]|eukprot:NP_796091.2 deleted in lung and esophageal cancer protein 1 homolog [Mus musculus]
MDSESKEEQQCTASSAVMSSLETQFLSVPHQLESASLSWSIRKSLHSSTVLMDDCHFGFPTRSLRAGFHALPPLPEPQTLRLRPASLRTQEISHLLARVFRNLYTAQVIGDDLSDSLIKARGSEDARHEEFLDQLQQARAIYKQRLDEAAMLERHIMQARARDIAETEHTTKQSRLQVVETPVKLPPVKTAFRWCLDSKLMRKHHLISTEDYYTDPVPFCPAPKDKSTLGCSKLTFSCEQRFLRKSELDREAEEHCRQLTECDDFEYTVDSLGSISKAKERTTDSVKKTSRPKNKKWMEHLQVPQRALDRRLLASMENRNHFLKNPRFFPPNTPHGGKSLIVPLSKPERRASLNAEPEWSCTDAPVFLAKPSVGFFTDYEIGPVYEMVIALQNTTSTSRFLRVLPPSSPYFALGLGMFPGKGGIVAPGMTCQYIVQFIPDCLGDFDDFILVETQSPHTLVIPLQARRPPPVLTLSPVLDCGHCLIGGVKITKFICKNVGFSVGKFCIMPQKSWPPPSFRAVATTGFVEQPPFGVMPSVFELAPGYAILLEVLFLPTGLGQAEETFIIVCDNCQIKEVVVVGTGQLVALDLIHISGGKNEPDPGELKDLTAQYFIRFEPENVQSTAKKQLIIRNATHVELAFHWQIMKPNLQPLMPGETHSSDSIKCHPDRETAFSIIPEKGILESHSDQEFILSFSPYKLKCFHSVLQMVLEAVPEPLSSGLENLGDYSYSVDDMIVLEIEVKGLAEPFQVLLEPYALIIPGENYIGITVKKDFKMWNNSKSPIRYMWGKISHCHIIEVEPCTGVIEPNEVGDFELNLTGGVPGPTSQDLECEIKDSPCPVVLHIEASFKGPALTIDVPALQFGLLRLGKKASISIQIRNVSQLSAVWHLKESPVCLAERDEDVSPFDIEPFCGQLLPLGECRVTITLEASQCQRLQTVLELEVENGSGSYLPVYAEVQQPHVYLKNSHLEFSNLYLGVSTKSRTTLVNGTLLPTRFHWGKLLGPQADLCTMTVSPTQGLLGPSEELQLTLELTTHTEEKLTNLVLLCHVSGMEKPLVLGISGKPLGLQVTISIVESDGSSTTSTTQEELRLDFGSKVPLRTPVIRHIILTNCSPIQTPFTLTLEYFGSSQDSLYKKTSVPDVPPALLKTARIQQHVAKKERLDFVESMLSHRKGAAFLPHISQGMLGAYQELCIDITGCANMWGEYWDELLCVVGDLPVTVIPVYMAVVGCPISSLRNTCYSVAPFQKEPITRFGTQISGGDTVTRSLRLYNSSHCDIRLDWETYIPEEKADRLLELLVFYGPPFPLRDQDGSEIVCPETSEASLPGSPCPSNVSVSSHTVPSTVSSGGGGGTRAEEQIMSVILQRHEAVPAGHIYRISPKQLVIPAGDHRTIYISFTPTVLDPGVMHKVGYTGYALGFMSLDKETDRQIPGRMRRLQDFAVSPLRLDLNGHVRHAQLHVELDSSGYLEFWCQASDLIPQNPCSGVLSDRITTRHLKLTNTTEILYDFQARVSRPFFISQGGASWDSRAPHQCEEGTASTGQWLMIRPQDNMLVDVSFSLSLELLSYQKLSADQMLPGVDIQESENGERKMVFTQNLLLGFTNQTVQEVPLRAFVTLPAPQLSTSWVDFGTCLVNQQHTRQIYLMNLSCCLSYWTVLLGQEEPAREDHAFGVSPGSGLLEARATNAPPTSSPLQVFFNPRSSILYESTLVVEGVLSEKPCVLRLRGLGSYDERYVKFHEF